MSDAILIDSSDKWITTLTLNRPDKRNALSIELIEQMTCAIEQASADLNRRVLLIKGNGPVFCAGLDLKEASDPAKAHKSAETLCAMYKTLCASPLIVIGAAQGTAMGGGAGLVAACDLVVASDDLKISYPEVHRGLVAALVTCLLRRQVSDRIARELLLLGQSVPAPEALRLGLVTKVVPAQELNDRAMDLAKEACKGAPSAIVRTKNLLDRIPARPIAEELQRALEFHLTARNSPEAAEGVQAFLEKRQPNWPPRI